MADSSNATSSASNNSEGGKNRRKASGIVVDSKSLLRLSVPFFILLISNVAIILAVSWQTSDAIARAESADANTSIAMFQLASSILTIMSWGMFVFGLVCAILWLVYSHRIFGPMVPIRRQIERLSKGDYDGRIHLRKRDEFKDVANELNRLAEILKSTRGK